MEDGASLREMYAHLIESLGAEVVQAPDGRTALEKLHDDRLGLVVLDINLPGISGLRVLEWMSVNSPELPVLVITGMEEPPRELLRFPNVVRIIATKPVPNDVFKSLVEGHAVIKTKNAPRAAWNSTSSDPGTPGEDAAGSRKGAARSESIR